MRKLPFQNSPNSFGMCSKLGCYRQVPSLSCKYLSEHERERELTPDGPIILVGAVHEIIVDKLLWSLFHSPVSSGVFYLKERVF